MALNDTQLQTVASKLFLLQPAASTKLTKPVDSTGADSLATRLDPIGSDARWSGWGIGVVDFTKSLSSPRIWLHNGDDAWRVGSTAKVAILLAAAQLRDDVRWVQETKLLSTPAEYDELFALPKLWNLSPLAGVREIASTARAPRISTIFDFTKAPAVDFAGPEPGTPDFANILDRLALVQGKAVHEAHLNWPLATDFDFSERLWLAGARSDNVAATSCMSEIGLAYLKAVQRAYGLFEPRKGMHLLLAGPYSVERRGIPVSVGSTATYRPLVGIERNRVKDALYDPATKRFDDQDSWIPGSAAALAAYLSAWIQTDLVSLRHGLSRGQIAHDMISAYLSRGTPGRETHSFIANGVKSVATVTLQRSKIGLLGKEDGAPRPLNAEFVYLETKERLPSTLEMKYGVVVAGIQHRPDPVLTASMTVALGKAIHEALAAP